MRRFNRSNLLLRQLIKIPCCVSQERHKEITTSDLRKLPFSLGFCALLGASLLVAQEPSPAARIVDRIEEGRLVTLPGNTHPAARARNDRGPVSGEMPMSGLVLVLSRGTEQQAAFDKFVASQYDPASPNYHQWLDAEAVGIRFGPAQADLDSLTDWLHAQGFTVDEIAKSRMSIRFTGTAAQVQSAFHTEIHNLEVKGVAHIANMTDPKIPAALASAVVGIKALHSFKPRPMHRLGSLVTRDGQTGKWNRVTQGEQAAPSLGKAGVPSAQARPQFGVYDQANQYQIEDVTPYDFAAIYNVTPLWNSGINGAGQTIAVAGTSDINQADVSSFKSAFGLPAGLPVIQKKGVNGVDPGVCATTNAAGTCGLGDLYENTLDVEWSGAVAPGAQVVLVTSGLASASSVDDPIWDDANYVIQNQVANIINVSYGMCELGNGTAGNVSYYNLWQQAAAQGIAAFISTGDSGSPACDQGMDSGGTPYAAEYGLSVNGLASTPYNTAVGGTDLNWGSKASPYWNSSNDSHGASAKGYVPEVPWNDTCTNPLVVSYLEQVAQAINVSGVTDAETACAFAASNYYNNQVNYYLGFYVDGYVDTVGAGGGKSNCVANDGANVSSCNTATTTGKSNGSLTLVNDGWPKPLWQTAVSGIPADGVRDIPDVSFFASNGFLGSAYLVCVSEAGSACTYSATTENLYQEVGGTSVSSPAMAGVMALINQKANKAQGNPNAALYLLASKQNYSKCSAESVKASSTACYFNDVDTGTIAMACDYGAFGYTSPDCKVTHSGDTVGILNGYGGAAGYDLATGLGSLNVANVVNANVWGIVIAPAVGLTPGSLTFAPTVVGTPAATQTITLKNTGNAALTLSAGAITDTGDSTNSFSQTNNCPASLAAGASCSITVKFTPQQTGTLTAQISVTDNAANSPQTASLSGTGNAAAPAASLSAQSLSFANTAVGSSASTQKITVTSSGNAPLVMGNPAVSISGANPNSFTQNNTCGASVAVGKNCVITVTFKPQSIGQLSATLSIADNAPNTPQAVTLSGTGTGALAGVSTPSLTFAAAAIGVAAPTQQVTLSNTGNAALSLSGSAIGINGANAGSFSQTNNCGGSVAASGSCFITVTFKPTAGGPLSASLNIGGNSGGLPLQVALSGTGQTAVAGLSTSSLTFPGTAVGVTAATQPITLSNTGAAALSLSSSAITISGANANAFSQANNCGTSVAAGASCIITVSFTPKAAGALAATLKIAGNSGGLPLQASLSGTGTAPVASLSTTSLPFGNVAVGATPSPTMQVTLNNTGNGALSLTGAGVTISGSGAAVYSQTNTCAAGVASGSSCTITVTFAPTAAGAQSATLNIADNAAGSPQKVTLSGTGTQAVVSLNPTSLSFATTAVGTAAKTQSITLKNTGNLPLTLNGAGQGITIAGTNAASFSQTNTCGAAVAGGSNCTITVTFKPTAKGTLTATVRVADNAANSPQTVALSGSGK